MRIFQLNFRILGLLFFLAIALPAHGDSGVTADPTALDFGEVGVNTQSDPLEVTLTKTLPGDGQVGQIALAGENPRQFLILEDFCSLADLGDGESCGIQLIYSPDFDLPGGVGSTSANLQVPFETSPTLVIPLSGFSLLPVISGTPLSLDFPTTTTGQTSDNSVITIQNSGPTDLNIVVVAINGPDALSFNLVSDDCSFHTISPGGTCQLEVFFRPISIGELTANLIVNSSDPVTPFFSISLAGKGKGSGGCILGTSASGSPLLGWFLLLLPTLRVVYSAKGRPTRPSCYCNRRNG